VRGIAAWSASFTSLLSKPSSENIAKKKDNRRDTFISVSDAHTAGLQIDPSPPRTGTARPTSRPLSMFQPFQPPPMEIEKDTLPELQPIFNFLNTHTQKLYTEGYFLKLADLTPGQSVACDIVCRGASCSRIYFVWVSTDTVSDGKPVNDRSWKECFAQLRGTVLSLWNAAELDAAGQNEEVLPTFINLTDASIKMVGCVPDVGVPWLIRCRSTRCLPGLPIYHHLRTFSAYQRRAVIAFSCILIRITHSPNGPPGYGFACLSTQSYRRYTPVR